MPPIDPRNIEVVDDVGAAKLRRMTPRESLQEAIRLTEKAREELAGEISADHPGWSAQEVQLERNQRWLLNALDGEVFGPHSVVLYDLLRASRNPSVAVFDHAADAVLDWPEAFERRFQSAIEQLGLEREWESVLEKLGDRLV